MAPLAPLTPFSGLFPFCIFVRELANAPFLTLTPHLPLSLFILCVFTSKYLEDRPPPFPFLQRVLPRMLSRSSFVPRFLSTVEWCKNRHAETKCFVVLDAAKWKSICLRLKTFFVVLLCLCLCLALSLADEDNRTNERKQKQRNVRIDLASCSHLSWSITLQRQSF